MTRGVGCSGSRWEIPRCGCQRNRLGMTLGVECGGSYWEIPRYGCYRNRHGMTLGVGFWRRYGNSITYTVATTSLRRVITNASNAVRGTILATLMYSRGL